MTLHRRMIRDQTVQQITAFVISKPLDPDDPPPSESQLPDTFGISRLSVREATTALEIKGFVERKTGVGLTVRMIDFDCVTDTFGLSSLTFSP